MTDSTSILFRLKLDFLNSAWIEGLFEAFKRGGCYTKGDNISIMLDRVKAVNKSEEVKYDEIFRTTIGVKDVASVIAPNVEGAFVSVSDFLYTDYFNGNSANQELESYTLYLRLQKHGDYVKLVVDNDLNDQMFKTYLPQQKLSSNFDRFYRLVLELVRYLRPLYGCVVTTYDESIRESFSRRMGRLSYSEILNPKCNGKPEEWLVPNVVIFGPKAKDSLQSIKGELSNLCPRLDVIHDNMVLSIDPFGADGLKSWQRDYKRIRELLGSRLSELSED